MDGLIWGDREKWKEGKRDDDAPSSNHVDRELRGVRFSCDGGVVEQVLKGVEN